MRRILILNEVGTSYPAINLFDEGIRVALEHSPYRIEIYREYLDTILFPDPADQQRFRNFYIRKYKNRRPDVIITVGPSPLKFMQKSHESAFPGVPIIFCLPNRVPGDAPLDAHFTGVEYDMAPAETLEVALRLKPHTEQVVVVAGTSAFDKEQLRMVKERLKIYEDRISISYLTDLSMPAFLERLKHLPGNTIVILSSISQDAAGARFNTAAESGPMVVAAANAPVFSLYDASLNHGEVGGKLSNVVESGKIVGGMAVRMLAGEQPKDVLPVTGVTTYMFDWRALKRWGLEEKNLPPGSVVLNRQLSIWESHKSYIVGAISLILLEALLIFGLLWNRNKRRKAENQLAVTYDRLRMAVEAGRFVGWDFDINAGTNRWFGDLQGMFGIPSESYSAAMGEFHRRVHPEDVDLVSRAIESARQSRQPYTAEFRIPRDDGTVRWVLAKGKFYYASNGEAERMLGLALDVTERKLAEEALATFSRRLIQAQEQERLWIARELHDDLNQRVAMAEIDVDRLRQRPPQSTDEFQTRMQRLQLRLAEIGVDMQAMSHHLHSSKLEHLGLVAACQSFCAEVAERQKVSIDFEADGIPSALSHEISICLFRVLQESLKNAIKHSGAQHFEARLRRRSGGIHLLIRDDGMGFDVDAATDNRGLGLVSMRERVSLVKGTIVIASKPMAGTVIKVSIPIVLTSSPLQMTTDAA